MRLGSACLDAGVSALIAGGVGFMTPKLYRIGCHNNWAELGCCLTEYKAVEKRQRR